MEEFLLLLPTFLNTIAVCGIIAICLVELNTMYTKHRPLRRAQYIILMTGAMFSGFQPFLWATIPSLGTAFMSTAVLIFFIIHSSKRSYPNDTKKK